MKYISNKIQEINLKIIELEHKVAFQELTMDTLNDEIYRQQKKIDILETKLLLITKKIKEINTSNIELQENETKPPHY